MNTTMGLRRSSTPIAPTVNRKAASPSRYGKRLGFSIRAAPSPARAPGQIHSPDRRDQQEHRGDLERQQVVGEQLPGHRLHVTGIVHGGLRGFERMVRVAWR